MSVTFASPDLGWVLGTAPCARPPCTSVLRTSDGGRTWVGIPAPITPISASDPAFVSGMPSGSGVSALRFADPLDGWAFGPDLWATHDGGATWQRLSIPGYSSVPVVVLEAARGEAHLAFYDTASQAAVRIASSPVGSDGWRVSPTALEIGAGPVPSTQLVLSGSTGWMLQVDRTVVGGAQLQGGEWKSWVPVCAGVSGPAVLSASSASELAAACDVGLWSTPEGEHLYISHDGGASFARTGAPLPIGGATMIASPTVGTVLVAGTTTNGVAIVRSADAGTSWQTVFKGGQTSITYLGFTTPTQGVAITTPIGGSAPATGIEGTLWMSRDAGGTWAAVSFGAR